MSYQDVLKDVVAMVTEVGLPPSFSDRAAVKVWVTKAAPHLVDMGYDVAGFQSSAGELMACSPEHITTLVTAAMPPEKIGDGHIIQWITANLPNILQLVTTIIAVIPK
jgi:hypothetical protein